MNVQIYKKNTLGTDYIVGDIHGCFDLLQAQLDEMGFDENVDRLFMVGDLVDRGPQSYHAFAWLNKPWVHAVRGNHEQMAIDFDKCAGARMDEFTYAYNGGQWFIDLNYEEREFVVRAFEKLPYMIELESNIGKIGIIHAEVPCDDWNKAKNAFENPDQCNNPGALGNIALWARDRIRNNYTIPVKNVDYVVVGHTPLKEMRVLGNVLYIDTGACFQGKFTILRANDLRNMTP